MTRSRHRFRVWIGALWGRPAWDWLDLLIVPLVLAIGAFWLSSQNTARDRAIALDRAREDALESYLARMEYLVLEAHLGATTQDADAQELARAQTLAVLSRLDGQRKGAVIQFLIDLGLATGPTIETGPVLGLSTADLSDGDLPGADLRGADLSFANLTRAHLMAASLEGANLNVANLTEANLYGADLRGATLHGASIRDADLRRADLSDTELAGADLRGADLECVVGLTNGQLKATWSYVGAKLPDGAERDGRAIPACQPTLVPYVALWPMLAGPTEAMP